MQKLKVAISGFGSVGRATGSLLLSRRQRYRQVYEIDVRLVAVCGARAGLVDTNGLEVAQFDKLKVGLTGVDFLESSGADVLIEAGPSDFRTGGPGLNYILSALSARRDVIAISKGALVHSGRQLRELANKSEVALKVSGASASALPAYDLIKYSLAGSKVLSIEGILNATTNYLLDSMVARGLDFDTALRGAQAEGFSESDPRYDTEGWDTACKLLILANFGLGTDLTIDNLAVEGIHSITKQRVMAWRREGVVPKLIGSLSNASGEIRASVEVRTYSTSDPFAHVQGKNKAIRITTDAMGEIFTTGCGQEPLATAAAALKDFEHILSNRAELPVSQRDTES